ncbi:MAG: type transport system permease protein [Thermoleophilaceae bacterium]|nr:type transport system permease protein [Thermoleophilaceae bacterium]
MSTAAQPKDMKLRQIKGPSAYEGNFKRFVYLTWTIAITEFRSHYFGSFLGPLWALVRPLMLFGVLYVVFTQVLRFGDSIPNYPAVLLLNIVLFQFFADSTNTSLISVVQHENVVRKMHFPRMVIPIATVLTMGFYLVQNLIAVSVFLVISGVTPHLTWLLFPLVVLGFIVLASGFAMLLASLFPRFRDLAQIWQVATTVLLYGSPILYTVTIAPPGAVKWLLYNPIGTLLTNARAWVIDPAAPSAASLMGGRVYLLIPIGITLGIFALGLWTFNREAPGIAERL